MMLRLRPNDIAPYGRNDASLLIRAGKPHLKGILKKIVRKADTSQLLGKAHIIYQAVRSTAGKHH